MSQTERVSEMAGLHEQWKQVQDTLKAMSELQFLAGITSVRNSVLT